MDEITFTNVVRQINAVDTTLILSDIDAGTYQEAKIQLNAIIAAVTNARLDFAEFYELQEGEF